jgi:hypothetical protein
MVGRYLSSGGSVLGHRGPLLLFLLAVGCSSKGTVTGKISYQGKPVAAGTVLFVPEQGGGAFRGDIRDGEYKVTNVPPGPVKIAVTASARSGSANEYISKMQPPTDLIQKAAPGKSADGFGTPSSTSPAEPIPKKFQDPATSGLTYHVEKGTQTHHIDIPAN